MTTPDLMGKVAEAVLAEVCRFFTAEGYNKDGSINLLAVAVDVDAILQRVLAEHAEVLDAPDSDGPWLARLVERAWDGKGDRWQAVLVCGFGDQMFVLVPGGGLPWPLGDFDRWQRIVPPKECATCRGARWVCEDHPDVPWGFEPGHCECGGAGMMCACNPGNGIVPPAEPKEQR